jgi:hypothetical protein
VAAVSEPTTDNGLLEESHMLTTVELISNITEFNRYRGAVNQSCIHRDRLCNNGSKQPLISKMFRGTTAIDFTPNCGPETRSYEANDSPEHTHQPAVATQPNSNTEYGFSFLFLANLQSTLQIEQ